MSDLKKEPINESTEHATLLRALGYEFRDPSLLSTALRHRSLLNRRDTTNPHGISNERLEFLGDAVLSLITANYLYQQNSYFNEGDLSRLRAQYVCQENLAHAARAIDLGRFIKSDKAMRASGSTNSKAILSDATEAIIGAVFIDGGLLAAQKVIFHILGQPPIKVVEMEKDAKTRLQEIIQANLQNAPQYIVLESSGPPHAPTFLVGVKINDVIVATATGENKRIAAQNAATIALEKYSSQERAGYALNHASIKDKLKAFAKSLGFDDIGITSATGNAPFADEVFNAYREGRFGPLDYLERTIADRLSITTAFPAAKTVIVVVKNYYTGNHGQDAVGIAKIARYAWGKDYHQWFKKKLRAFKPFLSEIAEREIAFWPFNDTGPVLERAWAHKAGLGFIGKSAMFIHRSFGTWTLLGGFATDLEIESDHPYQGPDCGSCNRCLNACPTSAIIAPHMVDANRCIATWTIERPLHKDAFWKAPRDHEWGFGCDVCQEVCPWNKFQKPTQEERFQPVLGRVYFMPETFTDDLRGSPLYRSRRAGLMVNYLRIQKTLKQTNLKVILGDDRVHAQRSCIS